MDTSIQKCDESRSERNARANWERISREVVEKHGVCWVTNEAGLLRIERHSGNGFFTVSAFHRGDSLEDNFARCEKLQYDLKSAGLGFIQLIGDWIKRDEKTGEEATSEEVTLFVPYKKGYGVNAFLDVARELALKYEQAGYILCDPESKEIILYNIRDLSNGREYAGMNIGSFQIEKLPDYYSRLRNGEQKSVQYVFEGVRVPSNHISAMAMSHRGHILLA